MLLLLLLFLAGDKETVLINKLQQLTDDEGLVSRGEMTPFGTMVNNNAEVTHFNVTQSTFFDDDDDDDSVDDEIFLSCSNNDDEFAKRSFSFPLSQSKIWNNLPVEIRLLLTLSNAISLISTLLPPTVLPI